MKLVLHCVLLHSVVCVGVCVSVCPVCLRSCDMYKSLSPLSALFLGARSQRVAGGDAASGSLGCLKGAGISSVSLCQQRPGGRDPAPPPAAPGTSWEERAGNPWPRGHCTCRGLQEPRSPVAGGSHTHRRSPLPRTVRPALIRSWLHTKPPHFSPREGPPSPRCGAEAGAGLMQEGPGWCRAWCLSSGAARGANSPPTLQTSLLAREKVPVPFIFLYGDVTSVRWFVGIVQGRAAGGGVAKQGGQRFCLPLLHLLWWLGSSPFPLKTL